MSWPKLNGWLKRVFFEKSGQTLTRLELRQVVHGGGGEALVEQWHFDDDTPKSDLTMLESEIKERAQEDCEEHQGTTTYTVVPYFNESDIPGGRCPGGRFFSTHRNTEPSWEESETPTVKGFAAQQMRHNEALVRILASSQSDMMRHMNAVNEKNFARIESLESDRIETIKLIEELLNQRHDREMSEMKERESAARKREAWIQAKVLVPTVVNKLAGRSILPEKTTAGEELVHTLLGSLTKEQFEKMKEVLSPAQLVGLMELYEARRKVEEEREAAEEKARKDVGTH